MKCNYLNWKLKNNIFSGTSDLRDSTIFNVGFKSLLMKIFDFIGFFFIVKRFEKTCVCVLCDMKYEIENKSIIKTFLNLNNIKRHVETTSLIRLTTKLFQMKLDFIAQTSNMICSKQFTL